MGMLAVSMSFRSLGTPSSMGVSVGPGRMVLQRMGTSAHSLAAMAVRVVTAALEAA